jgi:voltage-gated potassium channel
MKARLKKYLATSFAGLGLEVINVFLSLISCGMYVVETYPGQGSNELAEILLSMFFLFDYVLRVYLADNRVQTVLSPVMVIDMLTILPVLFSGPGLGFDRSTVGFMGVFRMMKVLRLLRLQRVMAYFDDVLMSQIFKLVLTIVFIIFFASGVFNYIENTRNAIEKRTSPDDLAEGLLASELLFHECAWFIVVTVTTVRVFSHPRACRRWRNVP